MIYCIFYHKRNVSSRALFLWKLTVPSSTAWHLVSGRLVLWSGRRSDLELGHWVTGSMGYLGHLSRPGYRVIILTRCETWVFRFSKKGPKCIEILTFNKWSSKFYFPETCRRQTAIKTGKPLAHCKRLSHNYGTNPCLARCKSCFLAPEINTLTYFLTLSSTR